MSKSTPSDRPGARGIATKLKGKKKTAKAADGLTDAGGAHIGKTIRADVKTGPKAPFVAARKKIGKGPIKAPDHKMKATVTKHKPKAGK